MKIVNVKMSGKDKFYLVEVDYIKGMNAYYSTGYYDKEVKVKKEIKEDKVNINKSDEMSEQDYIDKGLCPVCHEPLVATGGCYSCGNCSFSRCE